METLKTFTFCKSTVKHKMNKTAKEEATVI